MRKHSQSQSSHRLRHFSRACPHPRPSTPLCPAEAVCLRPKPGRRHRRTVIRGQTELRQDALAGGRYKRVPSRWETEFGRWVSDFGVSSTVKALAHDPDLRVTNQAVYEWLQGYAPRPARAMALVELSGGRLSLEAIYQHGREIRRSSSPVAPEDDVGRQHHR